MGRILLLGMFDGVHRGHCTLFEMAKSIQDDKDNICVYTFSNHPYEFITGKKVPLLLTNDERREWLYRFGADEIITDKFDESICNKPADVFAGEIRERFGADKVIAGFNYTFGRGGMGKAKDLSAYGRKYGFSAYITQPEMYKGQPVSSTRIRDAVSRGDIMSANLMLGYEYSVSGNVEYGRQVGRTLGYPTANIRNLHGKVLPKMGVYATSLSMDGKEYRGITNVGTNPTFGDFDVTIETHILDFDEDIYGRDITVSFLHFIRGQKKFSSMDGLKKQIAEDTEKVRALCYTDIRN